MKVSELKEKAVTEANDTRDTIIKAMHKRKLANIKAAKHTLKVLEDDYRKFEEQDIDDLELNNYEY